MKAILCWVLEATAPLDKGVVYLQWCCPQPCIVLHPGQTGQALQEGPTSPYCSVAWLHAAHSPPPGPSRRLPSESPTNTKVQASHVCKNAPYTRTASFEKPPPLVLREIISRREDRARDTQHVLCHMAMLQCCFVAIFAQHWHTVAIYECSYVVDVPRSGPYHLRQSIPCASC